MLVESLSDELLVNVSAGQYHSLAISTSGKLWTWGWGVYGQLGHGAIDDCEKPKLLKNLENEVIIFLNFKTAKKKKETVINV